MLKANEKRLHTPAALARNARFEIKNFLKVVAGLADERLTAILLCGQGSHMSVSAFAPNRVALEKVESDADFILFSETKGLISEHCTHGEARMAWFQQAERHELGDWLPRIYRRDDPNWVPLS
jgi:hypothetical protein